MSEIIDPNSTQTPANGIRKADHDSKIIPRKKVKDDVRARHDALVPLGTQVSSKGRFRFADGYGPEFIIDARDCRVLGSDGRWYTDWTSGLGALTLGHTPITRQAQFRPRCFPMPSPIEVELAEAIQRHHPWIEQMRFMKTGSNVTDAAVRLARTYTGRDVIATFGNYHGMSDWCVDPVKEGVPQAVRDLTKRLPRTDAGLAELNDQIACVILEPITLDPIDRQFLSRLRERCTKLGIVLIYDEIITGFRCAPGSAVELTWTTPDIWCAGKALGNGHPISVIGGRRDLMACFERTHLSGTHFGDPGAMQAALFNLTSMRRSKYHDHIAKIGEKLMDSIRESLVDRTFGEHAKLVGHFWHFVVSFPDDRVQTAFQKENMRRGLLFSGSFFPTLAHNNAVQRFTGSMLHSSMWIIREHLRAGTLDEYLGSTKINKAIFKRNG